MSGSEVKLGNPAVVGLAGFGMTTFVLQCHNIGLCGLAPVIWLGICLRWNSPVDCRSDGVQEKQQFWFFAHLPVMAHSGFHSA